MRFDIQDTKIDLIQWLTTIDNVDVLKKIKSIKESEIETEWTKVSAKEKKSIEKGLKDVKLGNTKPHAEVKKIYEKYL